MIWEGGQMRSRVCRREVVGKVQDIQEGPTETGAGGRGEDEVDRKGIQVNQNWWLPRRASSKADSPGLWLRRLWIMTKGENAE